MASAALEVEAKFDVALEGHDADLLQLPGVTSVDAATHSDLVAIYFDTAELDLLSAGVTLRRRSGGADPGWHLKVPWHGDRVELSEPFTESARIPDTFRTVVWGLTRDRPLGEVATLRTGRTLTHLRDAEGAIVGDFCDDLVRAEGPGLRPGAPARWREWELELSHPDRILAEAGVRVLCAAGASPANAPSKLARVLTAPGSGNGTDGGSADGTTRAALQDRIRADVALIRRLDPAVRAELPDAIHQMRVTARRLRSVLAGYRPEFDATSTEPLRTDLGWLITQLGHSRDLEVLGERISATAGDGHPSITSWVDRSTRDEHDAARHDAAAAMGSVRYFSLIDALVRFAESPSWSERARRPAEAELVACLRSQWRRLDQAVDHVGDSRGARRGRRLHQVRRAAKRLRYSAEAARPALGGRVDGVVTALEEIQYVLGDHHDALVAREFLAAAGDSGTGRRHRAETRAIRRALDAEVAADEQAFTRNYHRLRHDADASWLR